MHTQNTDDKEDEYGDDDGCNGFYSFFPSFSLKKKMHFMYLCSCVCMDIWYGLWWHKILMEPPFLIGKLSSCTHSHTVCCLPASAHCHRAFLFFFSIPRGNHRLPFFVQRIEMKCLKNDGKFSTFFHPRQQRWVLLLCGFVRRVMCKMEVYLCRE